MGGGGGSPYNKTLLMALCFDGFGSYDQIGVVQDYAKLGKNCRDESVQRAALGHVLLLRCMVRRAASHMRRQRCVGDAPMVHLGAECIAINHVHHYLIHGKTFGRKMALLMSGMSKGPRAKNATGCGQKGGRSLGLHGL